MNPSFPLHSVQYGSMMKGILFDKPVIVVDLDTELDDTEFEYIFESAIIGMLN